MKLSEQLKQEHECGDFGKVLEGYSERAKALEDSLWGLFHQSACSRGASIQEACDFADKRLAEFDKGN